MPMLVSIYMPTKNREALLRKAVQSVLSQTYADIELIVVNDASTDGTARYLDQLAAADQRVRVIHHDKSLGAPKCRNEAILSATGEYVTGLDDDDEFHVGRIQAFVDYAQLLIKASQPFSGLYSQDVGDYGTRQQISRKIGFSNWEGLFVSNDIGSQLFAERDAYIEAGLFDEQMPAWQDLDMFIRIVRARGPARLLDAALYTLNVEPRNDRISFGSKDRILLAYKRLAAKWQETPQSMRQALFLQAFGRHYGYKPGVKDLLTFFSMGFSLRNIRTLSGLYVRDLENVQRN
jgi:glycosyltransferase involved in cell wall biosynthesis